VGDHVVQLAGDPGSLSVGRRRGALLTLGVEPLGALSVRSLAQAALAQHPPDRPRQQQKEDHREDEFGDAGGSDQGVRADRHHPDAQREPCAPLGQERAGAVEDQEYRQERAHRMVGHAPAERVLSRHRAEREQDRAEWPATAYRNPDRKRCPAEP
jgi:hypothetical protein